MPITITVPADTQVPGDTGHTTDHNTIVDALTTLGTDAANVNGDTFAGAVVMQDGLTMSGSPLQVDNQSAPSTPTSAAAVYASSGKLKYVGADGIAYDTGRYAVYTSGTTTISATSQTTISGLSVSLGTGAYRFRAVIYFVGTSANDAYLTMGGTALTSAFNAMIGYMIGASGTTNRRQTALGTNTGLFSGALTSGGTYLCYIDGSITVSTAGTLTVAGASSASSSTFTTQAGSLLEIFPDS